MTAVHGLRVVGLDLSLAGPGTARIEGGPDGTWSTATWSWPNKGKRTDTLYDRHQRIGRIAAEIAPILSEDPVDLVVIEGPSHGSVGGSAWDRAGLWWRVMASVLSFGLPVVQVAPKSRAKWATGSGNGDKAAVSAAVARMWPDAELSDSDRADALALASIGLQLLRRPEELPFAVTAYRADTVKPLQIHRGRAA